MAAAILVGASSPAPAQWLDPDWNLTATDTQQHFAAGAVLDLAVRLPIVPQGFRDTAAKRILVVATIGFVYEVGQLDVAHSLGVAGRPGFGFGPKDWLADIAGAAAVEGILALAKAVF